MSRRIRLTRLIANAWRHPGTRWAMLGVLAVDISLRLWGLEIWPGRVDYVRAGTWGDWISGIGAVPAVIVALAGLNEERRRFHETAEREAAEALNRVFAWAELEIDASDGKPCPPPHILNTLSS